MSRRLSETGQCMGRIENCSKDFQYCEWERLKPTKLQALKFGIVWVVVKTAEERWKSCTKGFDNHQKHRPSVDDMNFQFSILNPQPSKA